MLPFFMPCTNNVKPGEYWYAVFHFCQTTGNIWTGKQRKNATSTSKEGKNCSIHENVLT